MIKFFSSNNSAYRLGRTIAQGIIGVLIANMDQIVLAVNIEQEWKPIIVALTMAVLSPIMSELGKSLKEGETE